MCLVPGIFKKKNKKNKNKAVDFILGLMRTNQKALVKSVRPIVSLLVFVVQSDFVSTVSLLTSSELIEMTAKATKTGPELYDIKI